MRLTSCELSGIRRVLCYVYIHSNLAVRPAKLAALNTVTQQKSPQLNFRLILLSIAQCRSVSLSVPQCRSVSLSLAQSLSVLLSVAQCRSVSLSSASS
jgi:hypothetical protein